MIGATHLARLGLAARALLRRPGTVSGAAPKLPSHHHYCARSDQEWRHAGLTCAQPWVLACPECLRSGPGRG